MVNNGKVKWQLALTHKPWLTTTFSSVSHALKKRIVFCCSLSLTNSFFAVHLTSKKKEMLGLHAASVLIANFVGQISNYTVGRINIRK